MGKASRVDFHPRSATGAVLLLAGRQLRPDVPPPADVFSLHHASLRQRPQLVGAADDPLGLGFVQHDNAFVELDHPQRAQELADRFAKLPWVKQLHAWARKINPLLKGRGWLRGLSYYW